MRDHDGGFPMEGNPLDEVQWQQPGGANAAMQLAAGDILMQGSMHAVMWVGGPKPVVHSVTTRGDDASPTKGALQQSDSYLRKAMGVHRVFRYVANPTLGAKAAQFAVNWATESNKDAAPAPTDFRVDQQVTTRVLRTPYSEHRHLKPVASPSEVRPWTVESLFRVVKALARTRDKMGLSPNHGVSCDQFVVYCYQAAALETFLTAGDLPNDLIATIRRDAADRVARPFNLTHWAKIDDYGYDAPTDKGTPYAERRVAGGLWRDRAFAAEAKVFRSLKNDRDRELIVRAMGGLVDKAAALLPKPMARDAKTSEIDSLLEDLRAAGSGFREMGRTTLGAEGQFVITA